MYRLDNTVECAFKLKGVFFENSIINKSVCYTVKLNRFQGDLPDVLGTSYSPSVSDGSSIVWLNVSTGVSR